ncbi:hypothetical protein NYO91_17555 [Arhodomonas aquaeolei]|uniref:hypothetical protein n=1 Tax=Arhodomonas aquaeolei TaxID=2369 RepID=UPI00216850CA|nr:hypothetical protein [Arhodomonas aquaeolei]MCS4505890.1 hypothetical protein [Arhodomonas aquaeolei]
MQHRYRDENQLEWVTELVGHEMPDGLLTSVRVHCTSMVTGVEVPWARKPYIIRQLIEKLGGGLDGGLSVDEVPYYLSEDEIDLAAAAITGHLGNRLPVVYVSLGPDNKLHLNVRTLAKWLSGMAHVLVEPSRDFSFRLMHKVDRSNAYGGAIGLYWPDGAAFDRTFVGARGPKATARFLAMRVQTALCQSQPTDLSTWMAVRALVARERFAALRSSGTEDIDDWVEAFDEERQSLEGQLAEAKSQIASLSAQLRGAYHSGESGDLLSAGTEQDLFPGERAEVVQDALRHALSNAGEDTRTAHILSDLVSSDEAQVRGSLAEAVRAALQDKMNIGAREISEIRGLGFSVTDEGKHYKAVFRDDPRYTFTLHKTASDHRAPKNLVSQINRKLFK